jgi:asparagine synthetase B (glutamine-hydrolysing)
MFPEWQHGQFDADGNAATGATIAPLTFSIGFDAEGYDEMEYTRITARHFKTDHHECYVTPEDVVRCIPDIAKF